VGRALDFGGGAFDAGEDGGEVVDCLVIFAFFYVASASHLCGSQRGVDALGRIERCVVREFMLERW